SSVSVNEFFAATLASSDSTEPFSREEPRSRQREPRLGREYYRRQEERAPPRRVQGGENDATTRGGAAIPSPPTRQPGVDCAEMLGGRSFVEMGDSDTMDDERGGRDPGRGDER
ncbi:hypothetical protein AWZ03_015026, partial [Drosophila navojoa]